MKQVAIITGCSSGIGYETSILLAKNGFKTYATMRNPDKGNKLKEIAENENLDLNVIKLDVTDDYSIKNAINEIIQETNRIDVLVNNAGNNIAGSVEDLSIEEFKEQFETNFFGLIKVTKEILPIMRKQRMGMIVNVSSIIGKMAIPLNSAYVSSKFAVEGFSESIRYELEDFGIKVILIEPGVVKSNFYENTKMSKNSLMDPKSPYHSIAQKIFDWSNVDGSLSVNPPYVPPPTPLWNNTAPNPPGIVGPYWGNNRPFVPGSTVGTSSPLPPPWRPTHVTPRPWVTMNDE